MMAFSRSAAATSICWYSMSLCWPPSPAAVMRTALRWKRFASCAIWAGTVAENISVRRSSGDGGEDEFEIVAKAEIEHLIGFVQHDGADRGKVERAARDVVAQASRGADDDVRSAR